MRGACKMGSNGRRSATASTESWRAASRPRSIAAMTRSVAILASDAQAENQAKHAAAKLAALGFDVRRVSEKKRDRKQAAAVEQAQKLVVIWSRAARGTPALRAAARRAHETGKLVSVSVGAAPPPVSGRTIAPPRQSAAWRGVLTTKRPLPDRPTPLARNPLTASQVQEAGAPGSCGDRQGGFRPNVRTNARAPRAGEAAQCWACASRAIADFARRVR